MLKVRYLTYVSILFAFCPLSIQGKVSIIIPCSYKHAQHLYSLLELFEYQTELPDEVVISLSEAHKVPSSTISELKTKTWAFPVNIIITNNKKYAGENRNIACQHAKGDIFICQDADDLPHPQRVEVIKYFFDKYPINQLLHDWIGGSKETLNKFKTYTLDKIPYIFPNNYQHIWSFKVTFGNPAIARQVFNTIKWTNIPRGQDVEFNQKVYNRFKKCIIVREPLFIYRAGLSTTRLISLLKKCTKQRLCKPHRINFIYT